jgi:hypothetical protein
MEKQLSIIPSPDGAITEEDFEAYLEVIRDALVIHFAKERIRKGLWKEYPAKDQINQIKIKADRVFRSLELGILGREENAKEELLDVINYAVFAIRKLVDDA